MDRGTFHKFFLKTSKCTAVILIVISMGFLALKKSDMIAALWITLAWLGVNGFLLGYIGDRVQSGQKLERSQLSALCMIKFPVLYLAGLLILLWPVVHTQGVLIAFGIYLITAVIIWCIDKPGN